MRICPRVRQDFPTWYLSWKLKGEKKYTEHLTSLRKTSLFKHQVELKRIQKENLVLLKMIKKKKPTWRLWDDYYITGVSKIRGGWCFLVLFLADHQGSAALRFLWSFLPGAFPMEAVMCPHRGWGQARIAGAGGTSWQPAQSHPALAGSWDSVSPGLCCFSSSANLCPLPGGSWGQEITEFPHWAAFHQFFSSLIPTPCPFQGLFSTSWGFHLPRFWHSALLSSPLLQWPSFPADRWDLWAP